ncbi:DUF6228 family protein [Streptomyces sp. NPDC014746]|uniref:DUF6228 family protein n=1 Tax=Streptomyces sp. NPDC014746 TaxID=3364904 RepID=UPI0036FD6130
MGLARPLARAPGDPGRGRLQLLPRLHGPARARLPGLSGEGEGRGDAAHGPGHDGATRRFTTERGGQFGPGRTGPHRPFEHHPGGHVRLAWGIRDRAPSEEWKFEATTWHAAGEDMRNLTAEVHTFIAHVPSVEVKRQQSAGRRRACDREALATIIFVATSGCTWRQFPPVSDRAGPRSTAALPSCQRPNGWLESQSVCRSRVRSRSLGVARKTSAPPS